jgi:hypothetical protein
LSTSTVKFTRASCWNLNVAIDSEARAYLWGVLHDREVKLSLCIKIPERINAKKVHDLAVGPSMAMLIDAETL